MLTDPPRAALYLGAGEKAISPIETRLNIHLKRQLGGRRAHSLEVGPGAGLLTLQLARHHTHCEAVDINPRAARATAFNLRFNEARNCRVHCKDIFDASTDLGWFDTVAWNAPFIFLPEHFKETVLMAYGGDMGIDITLRFLDRVPAFLAEDGAAHVLTAAPILENGSDYLLDALKTRPSIEQEFAITEGFRFAAAASIARCTRAARSHTSSTSCSRPAAANQTIREVGLGFADGIVDQARRRLYRLGLG